MAAVELRSNPVSTAPLNEPVVAVNPVIETVLENVPVVAVSPAMETAPLKAPVVAPLSPPDITSDVRVPTLVILG